MLAYGRNAIHIACSYLRICVEDPALDGASAKKPTFFYFFLAFV
jgi:hypothetical protein